MFHVSSCVAAITHFIRQSNVVGTICSGALPPQYTAVAVQDFCGISLKKISLTRAHAGKKNGS